MITQELETVQKPNIFGIELVIIEHPKTTIKLSKSKKGSKIITQQPRKIKFYTDSKAADCTLQLDILRYLRKKYSKLYEIKILSSKMYDEQLNLARSSIRNKLLGTTKELKNLKFNNICK